MFTEYKDKLMEDVDLPISIKGLKIGTDPDDDDTSTVADSTLSDDIQELKDAAAAHQNSDSKQRPEDTTLELEGNTPLVELDASTPVAELGVETKVGKPEDVSIAKPKYELPG